MPEEHDLARAVSGEPPHLLDDRGTGETALTPAYVRDDAEGTEPVAPAHDGDPSPHARLARDRQVGVGFGRIEPEVHVRVALASRHSEQLGEPPVAVRPDQQVDVGSPLRQAPTEVLCHAARDPQPQVGPPPFVARQLGQPPEHARLGVLADRTGVEEDHVGGLGRVRALIAVGGQMTEHELRVGQVHLAAIGLDVDARHAGRADS